jgi:hypothetical protein
MLSLDSHLEGAPTGAKSGEKWQFSSEIRASVHYSDLTVVGLELTSHCLL